MRALSATLEAKQKESSVMPLTNIVLSYGASEHTYTLTRILKLTHSERQWSQTASVVLNDHDLTLTSLDLEGYKVVISYGFTTSEGDEYSDTAPMWVVGQQRDSMQDEVICSLSLEGIFDRMAKDKASAAYTQEDDDTNEVIDLIDAIAGDTSRGITMLACFNHCKPFTVTYDSGYDAGDNLINTFRPADYFRIRKDETRLGKMQELLDYTGCKAIVKADGNIHIFVPTVEDWVSPTGHNDPDTAWTNEANAYDDDTGTLTYGAISYENWENFLELTIASMNCSKLRVWADVSMTGSTGKEIDVDAYYGAAWHNVYQGDLTSGEWVQYELGANYDVTKMRISLRATGGGTVGQARIYEAAFGNAYDYEYSLADTYHTFLAKRYRRRVVSPNYIIVRTDPDTEPPAYTGYAKDASADLTDMEERKTYYLRATSNAQCTSLAAAILSRYQLQDERGAGVLPIMNVGAEVYDYCKVTDSRAGDSVTGNVGYITRNVAEGKFGMTFGFGRDSGVPFELFAGLGAGGAGISNAALAEALMDLQDWLITRSKEFELGVTWTKELMPASLDDISDGVTWGRLKTTQISAGNVYLSDTAVYMASYDPSVKRRVFVAEPTTPYDVGDLWADGTVYKRCTTARASGDYVAGDWTAVTLDEITDGVITKKLLATEIDAGRIALTADNFYSDKFKGQWYAKTGVVLDAEYGVSLYGGNIALRTFANKAAYDTWLAIGNINGLTGIQCYVGTDGKIYAGGGNVQLGVTPGILITGQALEFYYAAGTNSYIKDDNGTLYIFGNLGIEITGDLDIVGDCDPAVTGTYLLGYANRIWATAHIGTVHCNGLETLGTTIMLTGDTVFLGNASPDANNTRVLGGAAYWNDIYTNYFHANTLIALAGNVAVGDHFEPSAAGIFKCGTATYYWSEVHADVDLIIHSKPLKLVRDATEKIGAIRSYQDEGKEWLDIKTLPDEVKFPVKPEDYDEARIRYDRDEKNIQELRAAIQTLERTMTSDNQERNQADIARLQEQMDTLGEPVLKEPQPGTGTIAQIGLLYSAIREIDSRLKAGGM